jgi:hypothetical protein
MHALSAAADLVDLPQQIGGILKDAVCTSAFELFLAVSAREQA